MELAFIPEKRFMELALKLALKAAAQGEIPVGAVVVRNGRVLGQGYNQRETLQNALAHAEMEAISQACLALGSWRLTDCHLYVTLEPCPMCAGAAVNSHISRIIYGADDFGVGCCGSAANCLSLPGAAKPEVFPGYMEEDCRNLLKDFFKKLRKK